ncbi:hypothetical protein [Deinococcus koreensis]|uniref:Uncharacterized protein n=1 Tax=Deinococcus koreensis TaxID=2054903 RepID=A0A2K3UUR7_9DEIO|nr:hypothetical protein [Deinococcus koreensis]PNY80267.1 hypothetical protein CVO96_01830 [Deinococcus koreensis]
MTPNDHTPEDHAPLPVNPALSVREEPTAVHQPAEQGPMPEVLPDAPPVPTPALDGLSAQEVTALIGGGDASAAEANMALEQAEGLDPVTES